MMKSSAKPCQEVSPKDKKGQLHGVLVQCDGERIKEETSYKHGKAEGPKKTYGFNGKLESYQEYKNDEMHGPGKKWHIHVEGTVLAEEFTYKNDKLEGIKKEYWETGKLRRIETYKEGILSGEQKEYDENGKLTKTEFYEKGNRIEKKGPETAKANTIKEPSSPPANFTGTFTDYYEEGKPRLICEMKKGERHGKCTEYFIDGVIASVRVYENGSLLEHTENHLNGLPEKKSTFRNDKLVELIEYFKSGKIKKKAKVKNNLEDQSVSYFENGKKSDELIRKNGKLYIQSYDDRGTLRLQGSLLEKTPNSYSGYYYYASRDYDGTVKEYSKTGELERSSEWKNGVLLNTTFYDPTGRVTDFKEYFEDGSIKNSNQGKKKKSL